MDCLQSGYQYRPWASRLFSIFTVISLTHAAAETFKALRIGLNVIVHMNLNGLNNRVAGRANGC